MSGPVFHWVFDQLVGIGFKKNQKDSIKRNSFCGLNMKEVKKKIMNSQRKILGRNHVKFQRLWTKMPVRVLD